MLENRPARQNGLKKMIAKLLQDPAARIRFYLHKEFRAAEIGILSTQTFRVAEVWILSTQTYGSFVGRKHYDS